MFRAVPRLGSLRRRWPLLTISVATLGLGLTAMEGCDYSQYPLEPGFCDDWCHTLRRIGCDQEPENCVRDCEVSLPSEACLPLQETLRQCYESTPPERFVCVGGGLQASVRPEPTVCQPERDALIGCEVPPVLQCIERCRDHDANVSARFEELMSQAPEGDPRCPSLPLPCNRLCWELQTQAESAGLDSASAEWGAPLGDLLACATDAALACHADPPPEGSGAWLPVFLQCAVAQ